MDTRTNIISLCSGIAGLDLGVHAALRRLGRNPRTVCHVEREVPAVAVLASRMADGGLEEAPIWLDLATFDGRPWRGRVDGIIAGVPCQPHSHAGKRGGITDDRWLWPHVERILAECRPDWFLLENVDGLRSSSNGEAFGQILEGLARVGLGEWEWQVVGAEDVGAPHRRKRIFLLASRGRPADPESSLSRKEVVHSDDEHGDRGGPGGARRGAESPDGCGEMADPDAGRPPARRATQHPGDGRPGLEPESRLGDGELADSSITGLARPSRQSGDDGIELSTAERIGNPVADPACDAGEVATAVRQDGAERSASADAGRDCPISTFPPGPADLDAWRRVIAERPDLAPATAQPRVRGVADGSAARVDRLRALGNAVVPAQAELAFLELWGRMMGA